MIMSGANRISGEAFAIERLRENPDLDYSALRRQAEAAGVSMQPIQYGRARKQLGLPPLSTRSEPKFVGSKPRIDGTERTSAPAAEEPPPAELAASPDDAEPAPGGELVAARRKGSPAFDFLVQALRADAKLDYGTLRDRAAANGFKIAPIMYGRAKAVLGLVPVKPRGQGKKATTAPAAPRTLKQVESVAADRFNQELENVRSLEQLVNVVKDLDAERRRLRDLLERVVAMIDEALG